MARINWGRVIFCGVVTGVVWTVLTSISTWLVAADFAAAVPGNRLLAPTGSMVAFLFVVNLLEGIWAMWLYAAIRPRYGPGPKTAALVGLSWWIISSLFDATWGSFRFVPVKALLPPMAVSLPELIVAALVGAWFYKE